MYDNISKLITKLVKIFTYNFLKIKMLLKQFQKNLLDFYIYIYIYIYLFIYI